MNYFPSEIIVRSNIRLGRILRRVYVRATNFDKVYRLDVLEDLVVIQQAQINRLEKILTEQGLMNGPLLFPKADIGEEPDDVEDLPEEVPQ